jgi:hypothetical protein
MASDAFAALELPTQPTALLGPGNPQPRKAAIPSGSIAAVQNLADIPEVLSERELGDL